MPSPKYRARLLDVPTLDEVRREMVRIEVDWGGIPIMASKAVQRMILLEQIPTAAANCIKQEILARGGELATPAAAAGFDAPLVDVIVIGNLTTLRSTISKLYRQSVFDMPVIADIIQNVLMRTTPGYLPVSPRANRQGVVVEETLEDLMGGRIPLETGTSRATGRATLAGMPWRFGDRTLVIGREGAEILEAESPAQVRRVLAGAPGAVVAFGPRGAAEAEAALAAGARFLISGADDPNIVRAAAGSGVPLVLTHRGHDGGDPLGTVARFFYTAMDAAVAAGVSEEHLVLDPGLGREKPRAADLELLRRLRELTTFGRPLLVEAKGPGAAAVASQAISRGADFIRVDDAAPLTETINMTDALVRGSLGSAAQEGGIPT